MRVCDRCGRTRVDAEMTTMNDRPYCLDRCAERERKAMLGVKDLIDRAGRDPLEHKRLQTVKLPEANGRWFD